MRIVLAPDSFGGTLSAREAAIVMHDAWLAERPGDQLQLLPQSDGGPGFVDALATRGGQAREAAVRGPLGERVRARWLVQGAELEQARGAVAYVEAAQACGLHLLPGRPTPSSAWAATSAGVGELLLRAAGQEPGSIVVGLGGTACTDGGSGMLDVLGGVEQGRRALAGVALIAATDVTSPLLGPLGAARVFGPQKGADASMVGLLERRLARASARLVDAHGRGVAMRDGAGAGGGLGAALLALGGQRVSGARLVASATGLSDVLARGRRPGAVDLVITGEGRLDAQTLAGKVVSELAGQSHAAPAEARVPVVAVVGSCMLGQPQWRGMGLGEVVSLADLRGSASAAIRDAQAALAEAVAGIARRIGQAEGARGGVDRG
ncbi:glycerate kinase [Hoyosella sp. G463]|uniref:Glycerate kinase n=1 Tax=Lolliginicoccus lacisalsi TaxID=2742202 RepID=A0A927PN44_9ACTN|nr:glycerate kinase [Lolliginicoccus lacisalsi]MBD8507709.1 glycerate kinase [Lolliginicoccus lacisalsi]